MSCFEAVSVWNRLSNAYFGFNAEPVINATNGKISISCPTEGASIGYKVAGNDGMEPKSWTVYQKPFAFPKGAKLLVEAHRIGFKESKVVKK